MKAQTCGERVKTAASEAEKPRNIQQKVDASQVRRRSLDAHRKSHSIQQKGGAAVWLSQEQPAVRLSQEQPSDEDEISQNSTACVDGRSSARERHKHVKRLTHGAKRDTKLEYRTVVLEVLSLTATP